jgi:Mg2+ and Co2+ transporter CorA
MYMFIGKNWLITIHSNNINLKRQIQQIVEDDKTIIASSIKILYYNIGTRSVDGYEDVLTAIEIAMTNLEEKSLYNPSKKILIIFFRRKQWISQKDYYNIEKEEKKGKRNKINNQSR